VIVALALAASAPMVESEITVIGRKLATWRGSWTVKRGQASCKMRKSTGDREIDALGCAAMNICVPKFQDQFQALADAKLPKATYQTRVEPLNQQLAGCLEIERNAGIAALADRRAGAAQ